MTNVPDEVVRWKRSTFSAQGGDCVEIAYLVDVGRPVAIRDSKNPDGPILVGVNVPALVRAAKTGHLG